MFLHEEEFFRDIIMDVSNRSGIAEDIIEKKELRKRHGR